MPTLTDAPHSCGADARSIPARADAARRHCAPSPCACGPCARSRRALADALVAGRVARAPERCAARAFAAGATASDGWPHAPSVASAAVGGESGER